MLVHMRTPPFLQGFNPVVENIGREGTFMQRSQMNGKLLVIVSVLFQARVVKNPHQTFLQREMSPGPISQANNGRIGRLPVMLGHCLFDARNALGERLVLRVNFMNADQVFLFPFHASAFHASTRT